MARGTLRIYLGAAPGVGKTYAMLNEGWRRAQRGADVVVAVFDAHDRAPTAEQLRDLDVVAPRRVSHRSTGLDEMDVDAVLARRPEVALVDEIAHTNAPGSRNAKRWQDIEELLDAGIDVISTVNVHDLESLRDVVARITGITPCDTVPDAFVRSAEQIELVDMTPEALRRRMAHGNIYPPERIDAALANYFRAGNLGALRELSLLWVAERVEEALAGYLAQHGIVDRWDTRERVVVGLTGAPSGDALIRRAARIAGRAGGELIGVRIVADDGLRTGHRPEHLERQRQLLAELDGEYHEVVASDVTTGLVDFARSDRATQLVLGASRRSRWHELTRGSVISSVLHHARGVDVHVIDTNRADEPGPMPAPPDRARGAIDRRRRLVAWAVLAVGAPLVTAILLPLRQHLALSTELFAFLGLAVAVAAIGGLAPGLTAAAVGFVIGDVLFTTPYGTVRIGSIEELVALAVFFAVTTTIAVGVDRAARRTSEARRARAEATALARTTADLATHDDPMPYVLEHVRTTFGADAVAVLERDGATWRVEAHAGVPAPSTPDDGVAVPLGDVGDDTAARRVLVVSGRPLDGVDREVLRVFANQVVVAIDARDQATEAATIEALSQIDVARTALLRSVSHDLRTPLATIKAYVSGLRQEDVTWSPADVAEALAAIEQSCDRLDGVIGDLLDASRLEAGSLAVARRPTAVDEVITAAVRGTDPAVVRVDIPETLPLVRTDPALLERALANVVANAVRHRPPDSPVVVDAAVVGDEVHVRVVDRGPGIPEAQRSRITQPFQRLGDTAAHDGIGLGLAITDGFVDAVGATLTLDDTPGGGLTVTIGVPIVVATEPAVPVDVA